MTTSIRANDQHHDAPLNSENSFSNQLGRSTSKRVSLYNDGILLLSFAYSGMDVLSQWSDFDQCYKHVGFWLVGSYIIMALFRLCNYLGHLYAAEGHQILHVRQSKPMPRAIVGVTWCILLPAFICWTVMGTSWVGQALWYTPGCLPDGAHPWFLIFVLILCYFWILMHGVYLRQSLKFEFRVQRAEANLRSVETEGTLQRWGRVTFLGENPGEDGLGVGCNHAQGLPAEKIHALPRKQVKEGAFPCGEQCAICIADFKEGDSVRQLPGCNHCFHQECIDLWLLRSHACPLCKSQIGDPASTV